MKASYEGGKIRRVMVHGYGPRIAKRKPLAFLPVIQFPRPDRGLSLRVPRPAIPRSICPPAVSSKETVPLQPGLDAEPFRYEIRRAYTALGQPESVHLVSADGETREIDHRIDYAWNEHGRCCRPN